MNNELEKIKAKQAEIEQAQSELKQLIKEFEANKGKENGYTWQECFVRKGFYVNNDSLIVQEDIPSSLANENHKNIATTKKVCKSYLAACQLSNIIKQLNEDFEGDCFYTIKWFINSNTASICNTDIWELPYLKSEKAANKLIETNTPLLKQYFGVE